MLTKDLTDKVQSKKDELLNSAYDRINFDLVLKSGVVVPDYGINRPVFKNKPSPLATSIEWILMPGAHTLVDGNSTILSFEVLPDHVSNENELVSIARTRRIITFRSDQGIIQHLLKGLSLGQNEENLIRDLSTEEQDLAKQMLLDLIGWEAVIDASDAKPKISHLWSMRGAKSFGRLSLEEIKTLTFSNRKQQPDAIKIQLNPKSELPIDSLARVLSMRRSKYHYNSESITFDQLSQILGHACGITGELAAQNQKKPLRAYPSPGALYGVDVYVIPTQIEDLEQGVFRYDADSNSIVMIHDRVIDPVSFCLPDVRYVVEGVSVFLAISIAFKRVTAKYGNESYRIMVAEAGCIAENLVLVAHALGLRAGPFTGVFDALVDEAIGLPPDEARFVVGVLIGKE